MGIWRKLRWLVCVTVLSHKRLVEAMKLITWSVARFRFKMPEKKYDTLQDSLKLGQSVLNARSFAALCFPEFQIFLITDTMMPLWICKKGEVVQSYNSLGVPFYSEHETWQEEGCFTNITANQTIRKESKCQSCLSRVKKELKDQEVPLCMEDETGACPLPSDRL